MKRFQCQACGQPLQFEDTACPSCERPVGYLPGFETMTALEPTDAAWRALADRGGTYRPCDNREYGVCNWLVPADAGQTRCVACRHNRMIPYLGTPDNFVRWRKIEIAKHRLMYALLRLRLPLATRAETPDGLVFDFLAAGDIPVMTGHSDGAITINITEADDAERERVRGRTGEPLCSVISAMKADIITGIGWCGATVPNWTRFARSSEMSGRIMRARCRSTTDSVV